MKISLKVLVVVSIFVPTFSFAAVRTLTEIEPRCTNKEDRVMFAQMLIQCAAASNTKSDEEGEDVVEQCEISVRRALCPEMKRSCTTDEDGYNRQCNDWSLSRSQFKEITYE